MFVLPWHHKSGAIGLPGVECRTDLFEQVPDSHHTADEQTHQVLGVKLIVDDFCGETWVQIKVTSWQVVSC